MGWAQVTFSSGGAGGLTKCRRDPTLVIKDTRIYPRMQMKSMAKCVETGPK